MAVSFDPFDKLYVLHLKGEMTHKAYLGTDPRGNLTRIDNTLSAMPERLAAVTAQLDNLHQQQAAAMAESKKPFSQEAELQIKTARLVELDSALNMDRRAPSQETVEKQNKPSILNQLRNTLPKKAHPHKPNHYQKEER